MSQSAGQPNFSVIVSDAIREARVPVVARAGSNNPDNAVIPPGELGRVLAAVGRKLGVQEVVIGNARTVTVGELVAKLAHYHGAKP
ncbi:MAG: hypothetical protein HY397_00445 [Candidatus Doudnabacteria bacterium]|nr:hypothetical protein [Candidatus Doudnabacteria bacterium]